MITLNKIRLPRGSEILEENQPAGEFQRYNLPFLQAGKLRETMTSLGLCVTPTLY